MKKKLIGITVIMMSLVAVLYVGRLKPQASSLIGKDGIFDYPENEGIKGTAAPDKEDVKEESIVTFKKGTVSHICYLYIDQKGNVIYDSKNEEAGSGTSAHLPYKSGYTLVVFIKQSTTGMIWTENKVTKDVENKIVEVIRKNDKSYKGHNACVSGEGAHNLVYNKGKNTKTVTYTFGTK